MEQPTVPLLPKGCLVWLIKNDGKTRANSTPYHVKSFELGSDGVTLVATFLETATRWPVVQLEPCQIEMFG